MPRFTERTVSTFLVALSWIGCLSLADDAKAQIRIEAVAGKPFGIGRVETNLPDDMQPPILGPSGLGLSEKDGRVLYPAVDRRVLGGLLKQLLDEAPQRGGIIGEVGGLVSGLLDRPARKNIYFLFTGDAPLELTVQAQQAHSFVVTPKADSRAYRRLFRAWWRQYTAEPGLLQQEPDYPPLVENYLKSMLARRLGLPLPARSTRNGWLQQFEEDLGLAPGTESIRIAIQRDRFLRPARLGDVADQPLPRPMVISDLALPETDPDVEIEPIAMRVPAECLYARFGSFSNFLWLQDTLVKWGGDVQNLVALRGLDYEVRRRIEDQLVVQSTVLARLLGDTIVADVAIIGTDAFFQEGGAFGLLFHARNNTALAADLLRQRLERVQKGDGVTDEKITVDGHEVSYLSSPDGAVRSFYVVDGDFHFVTRSKALVRRFLETGSGSGSLGAAEEFRHARGLMPLGRRDTVFVYLSDAFFQNLCGPHYRVETVRRMQAMADIELVQMALLASAAEGKPGETIEQLMAGGFLPPEFGTRPDGSRAVLDDGDVYDSLRGRRGTFLPVPDCEVDRVSRDEADAYDQFAEFYHDNWERLDPILVGLKRHALAGNRERVVIDARMTPFARQHYETLKQWLGPADNLRLAPVPGNLGSLEMVLTNQRLFGGLQDFGPPIDPATGQAVAMPRLRDILVGYLGTTGELGFLSLLNSRITGPADDAGYASSPTGIWRRQDERFTVFSFQRGVLTGVVPQLRYEETERPAQVRLRVNDLSDARVRPWLNNIGYARTRETSLGNLRLMHALEQQLQVPGEDCRAAAEVLLDAKLTCPLRGEYVYRTDTDGPAYWTSTALGERPTGGLLTARAPEGFVSPPLNWFRGLEADVLVTPDALSVHAEIVMQLPPRKPRRGDSQ